MLDAIALQIPECSVVLARHPQQKDGKLSVERYVSEDRPAG
jgi:hypothetical protein